MAYFLQAFSFRLYSPDQPLFNANPPRRLSMKRTIDSLPSKTVLLVRRCLNRQSHQPRRPTHTVSTLLAALVLLSAFPAGLATAQTGAGGAGGVSGGAGSPVATPTEAMKPEAALVGAEAMVEVVPRVVPEVPAVPESL